MIPFDVFAKQCPSREVFSHVTGRWGALVLGKLKTVPQRFCELREQVEGISDRMLTQTLKTLTNDGLVVRTMSDERPSHPEYSLTDSGVEVARAVRALVEAVQNNMPAQAYV
ncbi:MULTISPECIES: winged helix-turn-helix transcriptional regulator [Gordonia]|uniref:Helix-turn-helix domain-containing protein n=2 Tax=Gordonia TaxID=2053 RepID=A0ABP5UNV1_9ACTN|nr:MULTISPECIES: helix-turn-helix domain-containing protein [Gordonia]AUH67128.1 transcriptional regulator [Gordonia sp. YC-JH1]KJR09055.1 HxlR family transcriptional regulator [Gordonia sihwensis]KXT58502.1 HxlR family transcriptional regulator [Gordonia sp. QH-12]MBY4569114.1 transcriptional regulator [Gordonia sihwensis]WFN93227.1 helix-turn-helix domain-containing protein [Gordonia sihwensis]